jgi:regulator-associated protein of mTOR
LHYGGYMVPAPTPAGELWTYNKTLSQYVPYNMSEVDTYLGTPAIYILDCPRAAYLTNGAHMD